MNHLISTAELAVVLSCPIKAERKIDEDSSKEVETSESFPDFTSRKHFAKLTVGSTDITDYGTIVLLVSCTRIHTVLQ